MDQEGRVCEQFCNIVPDSEEVDQSVHSEIPLLVLRVLAIERPRRHGARRIPIFLVATDAMAFSSRSQRFAGSSLPTASRFGVGGNLGFGTKRLMSSRFRTVYNRAGLKHPYETFHYFFCG